MDVLKYVITKDNEPILFSIKILHSEIKNDSIRAGFLIILNGSKPRQYTVSCFGESSTLKLKSDKVKDKTIIESFLNSIISY
ncbi:hypothetical protein SLW70_10475 [Flavobacterium sp. NG2]|uniref:hypothetical protein n=1 Tax=Flavobacterium sp. NG2 TaxID=3097547 RepID=UPI002A7F1DAF|nr:hypothetical protein [Flavobacterium sp. NG2]WPR70367.1 hypothetical protein SLW70_10475 [Flavobacterium sp. NG2]